MGNEYRQKNQSIPILIAVASVFTISILVYQQYVDSRRFLIAESPAGKYQVRLFGQKERPIWFTVSVYFDAQRYGEPFWDKELLHSGDAMDISFELGWPNLRWPAENALQFYREEDFLVGSADEIRIINDSERQAKRIRVESTTKILVFELEPGSSLVFATPRSKGDNCYLYIEVDSGIDRFRSSDIKAENSGLCKYRDIYIREGAVEILH
jgi:hypothetical protein